MQSLNVGDVFERHESAHKVVPATTPVKELVNLFATQPGVLAALVTDSKGRYAGSVTRVELLRWVALRAGGRAGRSLSMGDVRRLVLASTAVDLVRGGGLPAVTPDEPLSEALVKMLSANEAILPVIDADGKILGDLRISEILEASLETDRGE